MGLLSSLPHSHVPFAALWLATVRGRAGLSVHGTGLSGKAKCANPDDFICAAGGEFRSHYTDVAGGFHRMCGSDEERCCTSGFLVGHDAKCEYIRGPASSCFFLRSGRAGAARGLVAVVNAAVFNT